MLLAMGALLGFLLLVAVAPGSTTQLLSDAERARYNERIDSGAAPEAEVRALVEGIKDHRAGVLAADAWRSIGFIVAGGALLLLFGRGRVPKAAVAGGLGLLILADQWTVDKRYVNNGKERGRYLAWEDAKANRFPFKPNAADLAILEQEWSPQAEAWHKEALARAKSRRDGGPVISKDEEQVLRFAALRRASDYRVLWMGNPFNDSRVSYFHKSVGGYHGAKLERYQELIDFHLRPAIQRIGGLFGPGATMERIDSALAREGALNMLNTRYLILSNDRPPLRNPHALGSAWFVDELRWVKDADEEVVALGGIDPARTALVDERFKEAIGEAAPEADTTAAATLDAYATDRLEYTVRSAKGGLVVFSAIWYGPDWTASIDGQDAPHARADYVLRALRVPAGEHKVAFRIEGRTRAAAQPIMLGASVLVLLLAMGAVGMELRRALAA